jgi:hypothetical protein
MAHDPSESGYLDLDWDNNPAFPNHFLVPYHCEGRGRRSFILFTPFLKVLMYVDVDVTFINNELMNEFMIWYVKVKLNYQA